MEAIYQDYTKKDIRFYYIYKSLAHPEQKGHLQPYTLDERLLQARKAARMLGTEIPWLCDPMDNRLKHAFGNCTNSQFIIDPDGEVVFMESWSDPESLRRALAKIAGPVENPTPPVDLSARAQRQREGGAPVGVVPGVRPSSFTMPIVVLPTESPEPHYVKLRAEVGAAAHRGEEGQLYLGFHLDPLHRVCWNNRAQPIRFDVRTPDGVVIAPMSGVGPQIKTVTTDRDPREFLLRIEASEHRAFLVTTTYTVSSETQGWTKKVTQEYEVRVELDPDAGRVRKRNGLPGEHDFPDGSLPRG